jgi:antirestriction protein
MKSNRMGDPKRGEEPKAQSSGGPHPFHNEARACGSYSGKDSFACEDSYEICSAEAPRIVERSYHEEGPDFEEWAIHYAKETYTGHVDPYEDLIWQAGYAGCLEAMSAESEKLHG